MNFNGLGRFSVGEISLIQKAYDFAKQVHDKESPARLSGEPYFEHPRRVAQTAILAGDDCETVVACLMHDLVEDTSITYEDIASCYGKDVASIVDGVTKIKKTANLNKEKQTLATNRKFVSSFVEDIRVIKVKLYDRLDNMRTAGAWKLETRQKKIKETREFYIPIARQIGAFRVMNELSDLCFYFDNRSHFDIMQKEHQLLEEQSEPIFEQMRDKIGYKLDEAGISYSCETRVKNIFGLYRDLYFFNKEKKADDWRFFKVILEQRKAYYEVLKLVKETYLCKGVQDFIANPKSNAYQSLHVFLEIDGIPVLVKIRDSKMDDVAAYGMGMNEYKQRGGAKMFQSLLTINQIAKNDEEFDTELRKEFLGEQVDFLDASNHWQTLPLGSNLLDFAYKLHTELGNFAMKGMVNGKVVPLSYQIQKGDQVVVLKDVQEHLPKEEEEKSCITWYAKQEIKSQKNRILRLVNE